MTSIDRLIHHRLNRRRFVQASAAATMGLPLISRAGMAQEPLKIAFSVPSLGFPFFVHMMKLAKEHAAELNVELVPLDGQEGGQPSSTKQSADLEAAVAQGVKGIVISPNDANALAPAIQAAIDAGVPVVTVDRNVTGATTLAHVGADNVEGGRLQGRYLIQILPDGGEIFELQGQPGATPAIDRDKGLKEVLAGQDKIKIVFDQTALFRRDEAVKVMEAALAAHPNPDAVVCANDDMAFGVIEVAEANNLKIPIIGFDALPEALVAIRDGKMAATIEQFPGGQARGALDIIVAYLREGKQPEQHDNYLTPALITAENLGEAERAAEAGIVVATPEASPAA
ncbi:MAG: LacI family transcriptional regulator [Chloroflexota bacterium]